MAYISFQPTDHMNILLYTGDASASQAFTGVGFKPDFLWIKNLGTTKDWNNFDAPRGATKTFELNTTDAQNTDSSGLISFDADGFTLGSNSHVAAAANYVSYSWLGAASGAANSDGGITTTTTYVNSTAKQSFSLYPGGDGYGASTVGHGLGQAPNLCIIKRVEDAGHGWATGSSCLADTDAWDKNTRIGQNVALEDSANWWNDTYPTSTVVSIGGDSWNNLSGKTFAMYNFCNVKGYFNVGVYKGNGNVDGPMVYTGFKPSFVLVKNTTDTNNWSLVDNKRVTYGKGNPRRDTISTATGSPNWDETEGIDFLCNGFKLRESATWSNENNVKFMYLAWAAESFVSSNSIPATAN